MKRSASLIIWPRKSKKVKEKIQKGETPPLNLIISLKSRKAPSSSIDVNNNNKKNSQKKLFDTIAQTDLIFIFQSHLPVTLPGVGVGAAV